MFGDKYSHFAWVDFGLAADDTVCTGRPLDIAKLDADRVNYVCINEPEPQDADPLRTFLHPDLRARGHSRGFLLHPEGVDRGAPGRVPSDV